MNDDERTPDARTRAEDLAPPSRWERARAWWQRWKDPVIAAVLIPTALTTIVVAFEQRGYQKARADDTRIVRILAEEQARNAKATTAAAKLTCERTRRYAPYILKFYETEQVLPRSLIEDYRKTVPKTCPK